MLTKNTTKIFEEIIEKFQISCESRRILGNLEGEKLDKAKTELLRRREQVVRYADSAFFVMERVGTAYRHLFQVMKNKNYTTFNNAIIAIQFLNCI